MSRFQTYVEQALGHTGFAVIDSEIACTLRPDLWGANGGMEAAFELGRASNFLAGLQGVSRFTLRFKGHRDCKLLARGLGHLAQRIEWITGHEVLELLPEHIEGVPRQTSPIPVRVEPPSDDRWHGVSTLQAGRTCSGCEHLTVAQTCRRAEESGLERPHVNAVRRCLSFVPVHGSMDGRTGAQLYPELANRGGAKNG